MEWLTKIVPGDGPDGLPILSVLAKKTYTFANLKMAEIDEKEQIPLFEKDEFFVEGDLLLNATKHESDLIAYKPLVDIILHACAWSPRGNMAHYLDVGIQIGKITKIVRVLGNRKAYMGVSGPNFSQPEPFESLRLDYSRAYGGVDKRSNPNEPYPYLRNPVGKGFLVSNNPRCIQDLVLPNIEDPQLLLTPDRLCTQKYFNWTFMPKPVSFGYVSKNFHPRFMMAGLPPSQHADAEADRKMKLASMPEVGTPGGESPTSSPLLRPEFFNGGSEGLKLPYLKPGEDIRLRYLDPNYPAFQFKLPEEKPALWIDLGLGRTYLNAELQTVEIYKETNQVTMLWRGSARYAGLESLSKVEKFEGGAEDG